MLSVAVFVMALTARVNSVRVGAIASMLLFSAVSPLLPLQLQSQGPVPVTTNDVHAIKQLRPLEPPLIAAF